MSGGMFSIQQDGSLVELREQPYQTEDIFQKLLADYPALLPGDQFNQLNPRRWLLVCREAGIPCDEQTGNRWSVDHLFLDQDAIPTLVEIKRSSDTRIRREVVGQVIEYASNATAYWPLETIRAKYEAYCEVNGKNPDEELSVFLGSDEVEAFWEKAITNLRAGRVRLLFVADVISSELKRIVEFLNMQMNPAEVLAVEIKQFVGAGIQTLVPRVIGMTAQAEQKKPGSKVTGVWDEEKFLTDMQKKAPESMSVARRLLEWAKEQNLFIKWGRGANDGTFAPTTDPSRNTLFCIYSNGKVEFYFEGMATQPPFDDPAIGRDFVEKLVKAEILKPEFKELEGYPKTYTTSLLDPDKMQAFLRVYNEVVKRIIGL